MTARVLVVDDINANVRLLGAKLNAEYYEVATATSGPDALALASSWSPDVILLDVMMPGMDGYEVCRRLKANPATSHMPVVMITALVDPAERVRGLEAGADDFLSKPVDDATLFARLRALLRMKQVLDAWRLRAETARGLGFAEPQGPDESISGARALILTEDRNEGEALSRVLAADGLDVLVTADPPDAMDRLHLGGFDLAVLSLSLGGEVEALRFASRLRASAATRDLPIVLLADPGQKQAVLRGFDLGANDNVLRPVDANELRARARNQVRRKRFQERLRADLDKSLEMAVTDSLTGLRNRRYVQRHMEGLLRSAGAGVLLLDVDRFKRVNDTYGHPAGDQVLKEVARRLAGQVRAVDVVARWGGEEFLVVLASPPEEDSVLVAERLRAVIAAEPVSAAGACLAITISIGVARAQPGTTPEMLVAVADAALYRAKELGRNRVEEAITSDWVAPAHGRLV